MFLAATAGFSFLVLCAAPSLAQKCTVSPAQIKLGETLRVTCPPEFTTAKSNQRSAKLYLQPNGQRFGLLPISVKDQPGSFSILISAGQSEKTQSLPVTIRKTIFPSQNVKLSPEIEGLHSTPEEMNLLNTSRYNLRFPFVVGSPGRTGFRLHDFALWRQTSAQRQPTGEYHVLTSAPGR
jgi:hypothetical protein